MEYIPAVEGNKPLVNSAEFIKLKIYNDVANVSDFDIYTFSSSYRDETIDGQVYSALGGLLGVGVQQRDLRVTSADTTITISGIDGNNIAIVLATLIRGSELEITRGFYGNNYNLTSTAKRFTGIVTSYSISEDYADGYDTFTVAMNASSYKTILENRVSGRKTNNDSWQIFNPTDTSMKNVPSLADRTWDFGMKPSTGSTTTSASAVETQANTGVDTNGAGP